jgi:hypothetical protein
MIRIAVLVMAMMASAAFPAEKKIYRYNCSGGTFTVTATVDAAGHWSKSEPVVLRIDDGPLQTLTGDPDAPDVNSFKNKDYEFYALKNFVRLTRFSHGVVVKTYNACRAE